MCGIVCIIQDITSSLFDLKPPFWGHHTHYIRHRVHCICVITTTLSMISQPLYVWYHISICETFCLLYLWHHTHYVWQRNPVCWLHHTRLTMTSFALQKTSYPLYHTKPQSLWLHVHFRHDITPPVSDITPPVSLSSQPLHWYHTHFCMTSHALYVWHHMYYI